jgi:hypothetical protein
MNPLVNKLALFGQAITQSSELLVELVNLGGEEAYFEKTPPKFSFLTNLDLVLGNVADGYSASSLLMELSRALARQETAKRLAPDVGEWIAQADLRINQLNNALAESDHDNYIHRLGEVRELVLVMREGLQNESRQIEFALNTNFGNAESLHDKQEENKYLIERVSRLTDKLMLLDYKKLRSMSGDNSDLLALLANRLNDTIEQCRLSLINSLPRLKHLLWQFEKTNKNSQLVWALHNHLRNQSIAYTHIPNDKELTNLQLNLQSKGSSLQIHPNLDDHRYTDNIADIVHSMKPPSSDVIVLPDVEPLETLFTENSADDNTELDTYMEDKLLEMVALSKKGKVSCLEFWRSVLSENSETSAQYYPSGFMQWAHKTLVNISALDINVICEPQSSLSGNLNIYDFTLEYRGE